MMHFDQKREKNAKPYFVNVDWGLAILMLFSGNSKID